MENKKVLAFCDTSSFNIDSHKNRITDFSGLGSIGKNQHATTLNFLMHPILICEAHTGTPLGISDVELLTRPLKAKREKSKRYQTKDIIIEAKESYKWLGPCLSSKQTSLADTMHITFVMDREGDIMEVYDRLKGEKTDVLVRSSHNRNIENSNRSKNETKCVYINSGGSGTKDNKSKRKEKKKEKC